jgi:hypothetical protein
VLRAYRTRTEPGIIIIDLLVVAILCSILRKLPDYLKLVISMASTVSVEREKAR